MLKSQKTRRLKQNLRATYILHGPKITVNTDEYGRMTRHFTFPILTVMH